MTTVSSDWPWFDFDAFRTTFEKFVKLVLNHFVSRRDRHKRDFNLTSYRTVQVCKLIMHCISGHDSLSLSRTLLTMRTLQLVEFHRIPLMTSLRFCSARTSLPTSRPPCVFACVHIMCLQEKTYRIARHEQRGDRERSRRPALRTSLIDQELSELLVQTALQEHPEQAFPGHPALRQESAAQTEVLRRTLCIPRPALCWRRHSSGTSFQTKRLLV